MSPRFSIVTPVFNPPLWAFEECVKSVLQQDFSDWEWCLADDCSTDPRVRKRLIKLAKSDPRIKIVFRESNGGIVEASNSALSLASGEFVALLDHDDSLTTDALSSMLTAIESGENIDYLYSDEDKVDENGRHFDQFNKPDFAPERLRGQNYCCHFSVIRRTLMTDLNGFRAGFEGSQDYDLILRVSERARSVVHIPKVLYHWRTVVGSTATDVKAKPYVFESARKAVADHCDRLGIKADVGILPIGYVRVARHLTSTPLVSIIIPTRGDRKRVWSINTCLPANSIRSILERSTYENFEIVVVHDRVQELDPDLSSVIVDDKVKIVWYDKPFDFSDKCNMGALHAIGEILVFLNDDTEVLSADWIESMIALLQDQAVGMVGPMTVLEDGRIQSAGHGNNPNPHNLGAGEPVDAVGPFGERTITREVSGVTGACMAMRKSDYLTLGGMSLTLPHSFNDVDLAYKVLEAGLRILWTPLAKLWHFESLSRNPAVREEEFHAIHRRWGHLFGRDRFTRTEG